VDVPAGAAAGLEGDVHGGDVDRPAGGQPDAGGTDTVGTGDGTAGQQLGGDARRRDSWRKAPPSFEDVPGRILGMADATGSTKK
jgi:hypothetical protein